MYDKYDVIVNLWKYLTQAKENDILKLPEPNPGQNVNDFNFLSVEEKHLIGFHINQGSASPKLTRSPVGNFGKGWDKKKIKIASNLHKIRHWKVELKDFKDIDNIESTYYVDPPYQFGGVYYRFNNTKIDYNFLAEWCKTRLGQTIVCENSKANWLPFRFLKEFSGQMHKTTEVIWTND